MELTVQEKNSSTWVKIEAFLTERIATAQIQNEGPLDPLKTADLRGRIAALRALKSLGDDEPQIADLLPD